MLQRKTAVLIAVVIAAAVLMSNLVIFSLYSCTTLEKIEASLTVKIIPGLALLGLNADTDSLMFGAVSPGISAMRKIEIQHSKDAKVKVLMEGELASWTTISPAEFNISPGEIKEVAFEVNVPGYALPGNYSGAAVLCIRE